MAGIQVRSPAFGEHAPIPADYSHASGDVSPPLEWSDVPSGTAELALLCEDPDAPGGTFTHWILANIPASASGLERGKQPEGTVAGRNDFGGQGYGGPHPPEGDRPHRYFFQVHALSEPVHLSPGFSSNELRSAIEGKLLASGSLVGTYGR